MDSRSASTQWFGRERRPARLTSINFCPLAIPTPAHAPSTLAGASWVLPHNQARHRICLCGWSSS